MLPILSGGRLAGRIDPELDRKHGILRINAMHWEDGPADIDKPVRSLARFLGAHNVEWP